MHAKKTIEHHNASYEPASDRIDYVVRVNRPASTALGGLNRAEKYEILKANAAKQQAEITKWLETTGLSEEVFKIEAPTVFNLLFITCTSKVAECLEQLDSVESVSRSPAFPVELLSTKDC